MNGVIALGHSSGEVTMWTPNMGSTPVVKLLAHPSAPVTGLNQKKSKASVFLSKSATRDFRKLDLGSDLTKTSPSPPYQHALFSNNRNR